MARLLALTETFTPPGTSRSQRRTVTTACTEEQSQLTSSAPLAPAISAARAALPPGRAAHVTVTATAAHRVRVSVELPVGLPFGARPVVIKASAVAAREPGPAPPPADR